MDEPGSVSFTIKAGEGIRINHADPVIWVTDKFLDLVDPLRATLDGDVLTLYGSNRKVVYLIDRTSYNPANRCYRAEWPD